MDFELKYLVLYKENDENLVFLYDDFNKLLKDLEINDLKELNSITRKYKNSNKFVIYQINNLEKIYSNN